MNKTLIAVTLSIVLSSCVSKVWVKDGATQEQFAHDRDHCELAANSMAAGNPFIQNSYFKSCMKTRGYTLTGAQTDEVDEKEIYFGGGVDFE